MKTISEGTAKIKIHNGKISKKLPVFYNPVMKQNRDISILILNVINQKNMHIALPLAASGVRGIRFIKELNKGIIKKLDMNDISKNSVKAIKDNIRRNKINKKKIIIANKDANIFLLESEGFNYIDIDPFGTPNPFLDAAVKKIARKGIIAVTATDLSSLAGTYEKTCLRKYWALPLRNHLMHEIGLRILIRKVQLTGAQYDKALTPIYSYFKDHYFRIFFTCEKSRSATDKILKQHQLFKERGPLWTGQLWDKKLARSVAKISKDHDLNHFLTTIAKESVIDAIGFYDLHSLCKQHKIKQVPRLDQVIKKIKSKDYPAERTHFNNNGIRSQIPLKNILKLIKALQQR